MTIKSLDQWREVADKLAAHNYTKFCWQYNHDHPEGFHAWFTSPTQPERIHLVTFVTEVQDAIMGDPLREM